MTKPFWYKGEPSTLADNENDLTELKLMQPVEKFDWLDEMKLNPEGYVPGQIYKSSFKTSAEIHEKCWGIWTPKDPNFFKAFNPETITYEGLLLNDVERREKMSLRQIIIEDNFNIVSNDTENKIQECHCNKTVAREDRIYVPGTNPSCFRDFQGAF